VEPKTWDILQKTFAQKLSFTKENYFKILNKAFQKVDIFTKKLILFTQATNNKSRYVTEKSTKITINFISYY